MPLTVCLAARALYFLDGGGGHFWAYLNWALALAALGCRVMWLETVDPRRPSSETSSNAARLKRQLSRFLSAELVLDMPTPGHLGVEDAAHADLLLDLSYGVRPEVIGAFRRSALVDIDPGLTQIWISEGQFELARHDVYFSIGETVGTPDAAFPDCGLHWRYTPPPVYLHEWPEVLVDAGAPYTTVSNWFGEWVVSRTESYANDKRSGFSEFFALPSLCDRRLELALVLPTGNDEERRFLEQRGWAVRDAFQVARTPESYRAYIQRSRGEFSGAKPSYTRLHTAWISDRTLCYLASGKPAIVQHTGRSRFLPDAEGLFRVRTVEEAARALHAVELDYARHVRAARALAEEYFDGRRVLERVLEHALG